MNDIYSNGQPNSGQDKIEWHVGDILIAMAIPGIAFFLWGVFVHQALDPTVLIIAPGMIFGSFWALLYLPSVVAFVFPVLGAVTSVVLAGLAAAEVPRWLRISGALAVLLAFIGMANLTTYLFPPFRYP